MSAAMARSCRIVCHTTKESLRRARASYDAATTVGFVPTMGALHEGHMALVREARARNDVVFASIYVNPTQFGPNEDLDKYPRQLKKDIQMLEEVGVVGFISAEKKMDHLFTPDNEMMYGLNHVTFVDPTGFDELPEGRVRPGHFRGVATIVTKLFNLVQPTVAYFGQKDAAQCVLIRRIVADLDMPLEISVQDTVREPDGLAMSSRNAYLTPEERLVAPVVYRSLLRARELLEQSQGSLQSAEVIRAVGEVLHTEPLVSDVQYVSVDSKETMQPLGEISKQEGAVVSLACKLGSVRLIDNIVL